MGGSGRVRSDKVCRVCLLSWLRVLFDTSMRFGLYTVPSKQQKQNQDDGRKYWRVGRHPTNQPDCIGDSENGTHSVSLHDSERHMPPNLPLLLVQSHRNTFTAWYIPAGDKGSYTHTRGVGEGWHSIGAHILPHPPVSGKPANIISLLGPRQLADLVVWFFSTPHGSKRKKKKQPFYLILIKQDLHRG